MIADQLIATGKIGLYANGRFSARELNADHGDVVFLAELFCGLGDVGGGLAADFLGALKAEEFSFFVRRFDDSIGDEG
ncbi:MAG: hypothetical protein WA708_11510 [Acidobacteriaceae bacterium]